MHLDAVQCALSNLQGQLSMLEAKRLPHFVGANLIDVLRCKVEQFVSELAAIVHRDMPKTIKHIFDCIR